MYVPTNNGWVYIYDAKTLEKIAQINTGLNNFCVVFKNDNLYIISTAGSSDSAFKVYSRQTGNKIFDSGSSELIKFKAVPNSNFDLFGITINSVPVNQSYYRFAANGAFISRSNGNYLGNYPLDAAIFEFFPDGSKYITSSSGAIYNRSMIYETSLPGGKLMFTAFAASQVDNMIYAGTDKNTVEVYSISNYQHVKTIKTSSLPSKIFDLGNQLLCVGWIDGSSSCDNCQLPAFANVVIEKIKK